MKVKSKAQTSAKLKVAHARRAEAQQPMVAAELLLLASLLKRSASSALGHRLGLSTLAWGLIGRLGHDGPMTQSELVEKYLIDKGQLSRTAVSLAKQGLIHRQSGSFRSVELRLAPRGRTLFAAINRLMRKRDEKLVEGIKVSELRSLHRSLAIISANATHLLDQD